MAKIAILHTGGTFAMESNEQGKLRPGTYAFDYIEKSVYPLFEDHIEQFQLFNIDSSQFRPAHWKLIAEKIAGMYENYDGFVVVHGTDTMAYTAAALSFFFDNLDKPVVLTGSQIPLKDKRSDALQNLVAAIEVALRGNLSEVVVVFHTAAFRGNRVKKRDAWDFDAFYSPNHPKLIKLGIGLERLERLYLPKPTGIFSVNTALEERVMLVPFFPGFDFSMLLPIVRDEKVKGLVLEAYGSGNIPSDNPGLEELFKEASAHAFPIVVCSQSPAGKVNLHLYEAATKAEFYGLVSAADMTREATLVKLMVAIGRFGSDLKKVKKFMMRSIAGEKVAEPC